MGGKQSSPSSSRLATLPFAQACTVLFRGVVLTPQFLEQMTRLFVPNILKT